MSEERLVAEWSEHPFTGIGKRSWAVEHRVIVEHTPGVGTDVRHQVRSDDAPEIADDWMDVEIYEGRQHGLDVVKSDRAGWWA